MICGHEFEKGKTCNREISFRMGFKLGMCVPCDNLVQRNKRMREREETRILEQLIEDYKSVIKREKEEKEKKEKKKKVVNVAIRHRLSKLGVRY